jgi:hypothetical protein
MGSDPYEQHQNTRPDTPLQLQAWGVPTSTRMAREAFPDCS